MAGRVTHSLIKALANVPGFDLLSERDLVQVVGASVNLLYPEGSTVFAKGTAGEALYIVLSGKVRIYDDLDGSEIEIAELGPGDFFGEMSLLLETMHTKHAQAKEDTELFVLMKDMFQRLLDARSVVAERLRETFEARQKETRAKYPIEAAT